MPEVTIAMPARNAARFVGDAVSSVLRQEGVELEVVVVDGGSEDDTAAVVSRFADPRVRLLRNERRRGIGYCHNRVIAESASPFIAHVDSDDVILPGALRKLVNALRAHPEAGQSHCYDVDVDEALRISKSAVEQRRNHFLRTRPAGMNYRKLLLTRGCVINNLRMYRRNVFDTVGLFNERLTFGVDYEMGLRVADRFDFILVPEFLYLHRHHGGNVSCNRRGGRLANWWNAYSICRRLAASGSVEYISGLGPRLHLVMLGRLWMALGLHGIRGRIRRRLKDGYRSRLSGKIHWLVLALYKWGIRHLAGWPIRWWGTKRCPGEAREKRVAYYLWRFPVLTQTFLQREVRALRARGTAVSVIATDKGDKELFDHNARTLVRSTHYMNPYDRKKWVSHLFSFALRRPFRLLNVTCYVLCRRHAPSKSLEGDLKVLVEAVSLAGYLREEGWTHLHVPWANRYAFAGAVAARLAGVPFTVQARAHDVYRLDCRYALPAILDNAESVITNSYYNKRFLRRFMANGRSSPIHVFYNGVDFERFVPGARQAGDGEAIRLLCVARLAEQKGLEVLLRACGMLRAAGFRFQCAIIGETVDPLYTNYRLQLELERRKLGLEACVRFRGPKPLSAVIDAYRAADIFVLPAVVAQDGSRDVTPNALIEAMAMELPVVSTPIAAIPEIVENGVSGLLVTPCDAEALAGALTRLIEEPQLRRRLGRAARAKVLAQFDIHRNIERFVSFFAGAEARRGTVERAT